MVSVNYSKSFFTIFSLIGPKEYLNDLHSSISAYYLKQTIINTPSATKNLSMTFYSYRQAAKLGFFCEPCFELVSFFVVYISCIG